MAEALLDKKIDKVSQVTLIPSSGGVHEVLWGDTLIHSKKATGKHPNPDEVLAAI